MTAPSLIDVLPCRVDIETRELQHFDLDLAPATIAWLQGHEQRSSDILRKALAMVELRLTGVDSIEAAASSHGDATAWTIDDGTLSFDGSALSIWRLTPQQTRIEIEYRAPFVAEAVRILAECLDRLLDAMVSADTEHLDKVDVVDPSERQRMLVEWNDTTVMRPAFASVHAAFKAARDGTPDATAVVDSKHTLTYAQLDARAAWVAQQLRMHGIVAGDVVAIALERSVDAVVAVLGTLKAGAAYLPIDMTHPAERLAFMLEDA
ncbi:MAG: AMP-binding protein, partial [Luteimonas sp.]